MNFNKNNIYNIKNIYDYIRIDEYGDVNIIHELDASSYYFDEDTGEWCYFDDLYIFNRYGKNNCIDISKIPLPIKTSNDYFNHLFLGKDRVFEPKVFNISEESKDIYLKILRNRPLLDIITTYKDKLKEQLFDLKRAGLIKIHKDKIVIVCEEKVRAKMQELGMVL